MLSYGEGLVPDLEDWKIKNEANLVRFAFSKTGSPRKHSLPGCEFWAPSGGSEA